VILLANSSRSLSKFLRLLAYEAWVERKLSRDSEFASSIKSASEPDTWMSRKLGESQNGFPTRDSDAFVTTADAHVKLRQLYPVYPVVKVHKK
jgi:hypothetical protein